MSNRNDIHRPGALVPADYSFCFAYAHPSTVDGWPVPGFNISRLIAQRLGRTFAAASDESFPSEVEPIADETGRPYPMADCHKGGACDSCGAWHIEGAVYLHASGECIAIGWQCAEALELGYDASARAKLSGDRKSARARVQARRRRRAALREFVREAAPELLSALRLDHHITRDIRSRLIRNASKFGAELSEKQTALVLKLAREAAQPVEVEVPAPVSSKRQTIRGRVVSCKTDHWENLRMTVKVQTESGIWLAWGTVPSSILSYGIPLIGCTVEFDALLKPGREAHFALINRPTKARIIDGGDGAREALDRLTAQLAEPGGDAGWRSQVEREVEDLRKILPAG